MAQWKLTSVAVKDVMRLMKTVPMRGAGMERTATDKFRDEEAAYDYAEELVWPDGPVCPRCQSSDRIGRLKGTSTRIHTYKCYHCRKPFTVKIGTIFEDSKVPMHKWLQFIFLVSTSKHRMNANAASAVLGVTYKTAAAMLQRVDDRWH